MQHHGAHVPPVDFAKFAGEIKSQIVHLTAMLLDIPTEHAARQPLEAARTALEASYAKLRESIIPRTSGGPR